MTAALYCIATMEGWLSRTVKKVRNAGTVFGVAESLARCREILKVHAFSRVDEADKNEV